MLFHEASCLALLEAVLFHRDDVGALQDNKGVVCLFHSSFPEYTVLFHEVSCLALLEAVLFHRDAVEAVQEAGPDLTDH